jgi:hypothetical protein
MEQLAAALYREEVARARAMAPEDKLLAGPRLFARTCRLLADGVRHRQPELDEAGVLEAGKDLLRRQDARERSGDALTLD